jgi:hypothetical protein
MTVESDLFYNSISKKGKLMEYNRDFTLSEGSKKSIESMVWAIIGDYVDTPVKPDMEKILAQMENLIKGVPKIHQLGMLWMIRGLEVAPYAMGYFKQFSSLAREDQVTVFKKFEQSGNYLQRSICVFIKSVSLICFFSTKEMKNAIGYENKCLLDD